MKSRLAKTPFYLSLRFQLTIAVCILLGVLVINAGLSFYNEQQRRNDQTTLQTTGSVKQLLNALVRRSQLYAAAAPRDWETYYRDLGMYGQELKDIIAELNQQIPQLHTLSSELQVRWQGYSEQIKKVSGNPEEPRLESVANWVGEHKDALKTLGEDISSHTRDLIQEQINVQRQVNIALLILSCIVGLISLFILNRLFKKPLNHILQKLSYLSQGKEGEQLTVDTQNEMGQIFSAIDELALNLNTTFNLTRSINQATDIDSALCFVYEEYKQLLPIDSLCLIRRNNDGEAMMLERVHGNKKVDISENRCFDPSKCELSSNASQARLSLLQTNSDWKNSASPLGQYLHNSGLNSALFFPFENDNGTILLFGSTQAEAFNSKHIELLQNAGGQLQHAFEKTELVENLVISAISGLSKLAESRDPETGDHLDRMSRYSMILAEELAQEGPYQPQISNSYVRDILRFAPMHDIGKVGVADSILLKPGRLTPEERTDMEFHPSIGGEVLQRCEEQLNASGHSMFSMGIEIAQGHHEKWDGTGYPNKLKGEEIPLSARIVAVADVFDALTSKRPYKDAWPVEKALKLFEEESGKHFDPEIINAFNRAMPKIMDVYERLKHV